MQYILTEKEYNDLKQIQKNEIKLSKQKLQELCTNIANTMPVVWGWNGTDPKPWNCIHTEEDEWYCDKCPVQEICPTTSKNWSK